MLTAEVLSSRFTNPDSRELGDRWLTSMHSAVFRVPSAVVPSESNYLLNPLHEEFAEITVEDPIPFVLDERLFLPAGSSE
jgi:RES domain-containing protein